MILTDFASNVVALVRERVTVEFQVVDLTIDRDVPLWRLDARMGRTQLEIIWNWSDRDQLLGPRRTLLRLPEHPALAPSDALPCLLTGFTYAACSSLSTTTGRYIVDIGLRNLNARVFETFGNGLMQRVR